MPQMMDVMPPQKRRPETERRPAEHPLAPSDRHAAAVADNIHSAMAMLESREYQQRAAERDGVEVGEIRRSLAELPDDQPESLASFEVGRGIRYGTVSKLKDGDPEGYEAFLGYDRRFRERNASMPAEVATAVPDSAAHVPETPAANDVWPDLGDGDRRIVQSMHLGTFDGVKKSPAEIEADTSYPMSFIYDALKDLESRQP